MRYTSDQMLASDLAAVLPLGDTQYNDGSAAKYQQSYDPSWGRLNALAYPAIGNHEYKTTGAAGYFGYFAAAGRPTGAKGYYSYDLPTSDPSFSWHMISLNSNCARVKGCGVGSVQYDWLVADLAAHPAACTLAYWHHPLFSSGKIGSNPITFDLWQALQIAHADIALSGHDHDYERFAPQDATGVADASGIREFVVGTGGASTQQFGLTVAPNSEYRQIPGRFGVLMLTLHPSSYDWSFQAPGGLVLDSGTSSCVP